MKIYCHKLTEERIMRRACEFTMRLEKESKISLASIYRCEHSPMRTQIFWIELIDIPSFVSVHLVRHKIGVEHFVGSKRDDLSGEAPESVNRLSPVCHAMFINAQALVQMSHQRLCNKAHKQTIEVMEKIRCAVGKVDKELAKRMVPKCIYRGGCYETKGCGRSKAGL